MTSQRPPIYLDYNGTTPIAKECREAMMTMMEHFGNPSSSHYYGVQSKKAMDKARKQIASLIGGEAEEITFMSNGTETINYALKGLAEVGLKEGRNHLITQASEHVAVLETTKNLESRGFKVTYLPVDADGLVDPAAVGAAITPKTICVSIMHSNNETGALQPIKAISEQVRKAGQRIYFHCDASQSLGKLAVDVNDLGVDMLTIAGHKLWAPKGVGALYVRSSVPELPTFLHGAGQEGGRRASTENVIHCVGLGAACEVAQRDLAKSEAHMKAMRDRLYDQLGQKLGEKASFMRVNGPMDKRLPNTLNVSFYSVEANTLLSEIGDHVAASAGAACHSDEVHVSHVLEAMGKPQDWAMGTCRFTVGRETTQQEVDEAATVITTAVKRLMPATAGGAPGTEDAPDVVEEGGEVKLTKYTHGMGCACKLRPQVLEKVLTKLKADADLSGGLGPVSENVLAGLGSNNEDACVYKLNDTQAVVATLDFFTPILDDPEAFGGVAAANALSDVYAMGAKPLFALNIVGFPSARLPASTLASILRGGQKKCEEAGIPILGGHTVEDLEPKYGLCVVGLVHPDKVWKNNACQEGDRLILTKPLGTGVLSTAMKRGILDADAAAKLSATLLTLNRSAAECAIGHGGVRAATDVTGFGLLGHLREMLTSISNDEGEPAAKRARKGPPLAALLSASATPLLPAARDLAADGACVPGGTVNNLKAAETSGTAFADNVPKALRVLLADAQTSGGLLLSVSAEAAPKLLEKLKQAGLSESAEIGRIVARTDDAAPVIKVDA